MPIRYAKRNITLAKELRHGMTREERHLWYDFLAKYPVRFQRQKCIDRYIADFYCAKASLVVELDGGQHYTDKGEENDAARSAVLERLGLAVLRFTNNEIQQNFSAVCEAIDEAVIARIGGEISKPEGFLRA